MVKKLLFMLAIAVFVGLTVQAQNVPYSAGVPTYTFAFNRDSVKTTDSTFAVFYAPYNIQVVNIQAIAATADTGSAGSAGVVSIAKGVSVTAATTAVATATVVAGKTLYYGSPSSTSVARIAQGQYAKIVLLLGTSDVLKDLTVIVHYVRY